MTTKNPAPARLFVLLARDVSVGVILRRGPSDWVQMIHWDTKNDIFTPGQWFHGRIYEHRCDLSPDGKLIVYFAYKFGNQKFSPDYSDSWTAISKPPYFTALALWPHWHVYGGGGYFTKHNTMLLNHLDDNRAAHPNHQPSGDLEIIEVDIYSYMGNAIFDDTLIRDGWQAVDEDRQILSWSNIFGTRKQPDNLVDFLYFVRANRDSFPNRSKTLGNVTIICEIIRDHRILMDSGLYHHSPYEVVPSITYSIVDNIRNQVVDLPNVTWADFDQQKRLVLAKDGKIFSAALTEEGELVLTELVDLNAYKPESVETPDWAKKW